MSEDETTTDELLRAVLWSRKRAERIRRWMGASQFEGRAAVYAVVDDHDRRHPHAPPAGQGRVLSIVQHTMALVDERRQHPEAFTPAAGMHATVTGAPDPALLALAPAVLRWLPALSVEAAGAPPGD